MIYIDLPGVTVDRGNPRLQPWFQDTNVKYRTPHSKHLTVGICRVIYLEKEAFCLHLHHRFTRTGMYTPAVSTNTVKNRIVPNDATTKNIKSLKTDGEKKLYLSISYL